MKITINTSIVLIPVGNVSLPDYGQRRLEVLETIEQERIIMDGGGSMVALPFSISGIMSQTGLAGLSSLLNTPVGTFADIPVVIESGGVPVWSGTAYPQRVTGVSLYGGRVLYADPALGFAAGDALAAVTVELLLKEMT